MTYARNVSTLFFALLLVHAALCAQEEPSAAAETEDPVDTGAAAEDLREGRYAAAADSFRTALERDASSAEAALGLARSLAGEGKYDEALDVLSSFPEKASSPRVLIETGELLLGRGRLAPAEEALRAALVIDETSPEGIYLLGEALSRQGKLEEARSVWSRVVGIYQRMSIDDVERASAEFFVNMGLALIGLNRFQEANDVMFDYAREKDAANAKLLLAWGRAFLEKYNYPDSRLSLRELLDVNPRSADALALLADNFLTDFQEGTKRYDLAREQVDRALEVNPNHSLAHIVRGLLFFSDGDLARSRADFERAVELDPSSMRARGLVATCDYLVRNEEALRKAEADALAVNPRGAEFFHTIARTIETKFRYQDVVRYCDRALEIHPEYWPAYVTLAINCLRTGEEKRGRDFLEKSWERDKYNVWVYNTRLLLEHMDENHREMRTEHFVLKLPRADFDVLSIYMAPLLEEAYDRFTKRYRMELEPPIYVEAFSRHKWFSARTVGLEGFAASGACFGKLVTLTTPRALPQNWGAVALHEFAHVITLAMTEHRIPRWFTEGLSVLEEGSQDPRWARGFEREIADAFGAGRLLPLDTLDFGFSKPKYPNQILVSYFQGCLIAMYIQERWGFDAILAMLRGYDENKSTRQIVREIFELSTEEFDEAFFRYVERYVERTGYEPIAGEEMIPRLELEVDAHPEDVSKRLKLAWAYFCTGNEGDTSIQANRVLVDDEDNGDAYAILGLAALQFDDKPGAAGDNLQKALELGTRYDFRAHAALGSIAEKAGRKEEAVEHYEAAKKLSPRAGAGQEGPGNLYHRLAALYKELGDEEKAVGQMEALREFASTDPQCRIHIAEHYGKKSDEESARKAFDALHELIYINPFGKQLHEELARLAVKLDEHATIVREYGYLLSFPDTNPKIAYLALARAHLALGQHGDAADFARKLLELDADHAEAREILEKSESR